MDETSQKRALKSYRNRLSAQPKKGGILAALRRSPLVHAGLDLSRSKSAGRKVRL